MKRSLLFVAALLMVACGVGIGIVEKKPAEAPTYFHVDAATAGAVTGTITFAGPKPAR